MQEDDGERAYQDVLRNAQRQVQRRLQSHYNAQLSSAHQKEGKSTALPGNPSVRSLSKGKLANENGSDGEDSDASMRQKKQRSDFMNVGLDHTIPPPARPHQFSSGFVCKKVTLFTSPVLIVLCFVLFNVLYLRTRLQQATVISQRVSVLQQVAVHASCLVCSTTSAVLSGPGSDTQREFFVRTFQ